MLTFALHIDTLVLYIITLTQYHTTEYTCTLVPAYTGGMYTHVHRQTRAHTQ